MQARPVCQGSLSAREKAKHFRHYVKPVKSRPETSAIVARQLVLGSLGIRSSISKEKRDQERQQLREARERKRDKKKKQNEMWGD